jgi:hypothetical protein
MSASTSSGISAATSVRKSTSPRSHTASTTARAWASIEACSWRRMTCGVNALLTIRRSFVWSGGSMLSIIRRSTATSDGRGSRRKLVPSHEENSSGWRDTCETSACRRTAQKPGPPANAPDGGSSTQTTGPARRISASRSYGMPSLNVSGCPRSGQRRSPPVES